MSGHKDRASELGWGTAHGFNARIEAVAAAWAMIAGWIRIVGQVTAVVTGMPLAWAAIAPIIDHTNGLCPCSSFHGW